MLSKEFQKLLLVLGQRRTEVAAARWDEFDLSDKLWVIPRDRMKSGRAHAVPLSGMAIEIIGRLPRTGAFLFPGRPSGGVEVAISSFGQIKHKTDALIPRGRARVAALDVSRLEADLSLGIEPLAYPVRSRGGGPGACFPRRGRDL